MTVFVTGTSTFFKQTSAPTGWTKSTTYDDATLRLVSGSTSTGGTLGLSSALTTGNWSGTVVTPTFSTGGTALTAAQLPSHTHTQTGAGASKPRSAAPSSTGYRFAYTAGGPINVGILTSAVGGVDAHSHSAVSQPVPFTGISYNFAVSYVDVIMATKD